MEIEDILFLAIAKGASDLHIVADLPPWIRLDGELVPLEVSALTAQAVRKGVELLLNSEQKKRFENKYEYDCSIELPKFGRLRMNVYYQATGMAVAFRFIPTQILGIADLNIPEILKKILKESQGLILVTGATGSGKSTTLAALLDYINNHFNYHIITIEDPIEFLHQSKKSLINQREVQRDTETFNSALRSALRQDPDVILVGELRDQETIKLALTAAETGHLVLATLHTNSAARTIHRIIDVFPMEEKPMVRSLLSVSLKAVIAQKLLKKITKGRIAAFEVMLCNNAIQNLIREDKIPQIYSIMQTSSALGMMTFEQSIQELVNKKMIALN